MEFVDLVIDFDVDVEEPLPEADASDTTPVVKPGTYTVVVIRHLRGGVVSGGVVQSGDIWYALMDGDGDRTVWVRAVNTTPTPGQ